MTATATAFAKFRKTRSGEWAVYGPTSVVRTGGAPVQVHLAKGGVKMVHIARLGRPFTVEGVEMVYGYEAGSPSTQTARSTSGSGWSNARYRSGSRRACVSGGDCSSFGDGRSCGGHDCDGY